MDDAPRGGLGRTPLMPAQAIDVRTSRIFKMIEYVDRYILPILYFVFHLFECFWQVLCWAGSNLVRLTVSGSVWLNVVALVSLFLKYGPRQRAWCSIL